MKIIEILSEGLEITIQEVNKYNKISLQTNNLIQSKEP